MAQSVLTPLQLNSAAGLLQNQGLSVSPELAVAISAYSATPLMTAFFSARTLDPSLSTLGANTVPAFSNSVPADYSALGTQLTTVITNQAQADFANGDISKFIQALNLADGYSSITNQFINSAVNSQTYLANTFTNMNNMVTGDITSVNLATQAFGQDLVNLGQLIDLDNLDNLGSPLALVQRIIKIVGNIPVLALAFVAEGVDEDLVVNLTNPTVTFSDSAQRLMYLAMTKITGDSLTQILTVLKVTTANIETMADLLNPYKLFPNSFQSLTAPTKNGPRAIYVNSQGTVNSNLANQLPIYVTSSAS